MTRRASALLPTAVSLLAYLGPSRSYLSYPYMPAFCGMLAGTCLLCAGAGHVFFHVIRTNLLPFVQSRASWQLTLTTLLIMVVGAFLPYSPVAPALGFVPLPPLYWGLLAATFIAHCERSDKLDALCSAPAQRDAVTAFARDTLNLSTRAALNSSPDLTRSAMSASSSPCEPFDTAPIGYTRARFASACFSAAMVCATAASAC